MSSTGSPAAIGEGMGRFGSHEAEASRMLWLSHSSLGARTLLGAPGLTTRNKKLVRWDPPRFGSFETLILEGFGDVWRAFCVSKAA